jgi:hypothetical protein
MVTAVGEDAAVVIATGYVVEFVGSVHVVDAAHVAVGAVVSATDVTLPVVTNVPVFGSVWVPFVNVVADAVTCQPAPLPVASLTVNCWSPAVTSTTLWSVPFSVAAQVREDGEVAVSEPAVIVSVPVKVQLVPAATAVPQATALASEAVPATETMASSSAPAAAAARRLRGQDGPSPGWLNFFHPSVPTASPLACSPATLAQPFLPAHRPRYHFQQLFSYL